ncbi:GNAT family protein [Paenibacillus sp. UMB4589-SE434]|uniref:GNAT family N-acetyltransferase n=1 Tax=Paenibacillus sp. UMB4589-SE434 TaxID=3046314 RepID=UPI00254C9DD4|nr:GNAT family protein [Paenibacillus sp. UMB4589-SE434]MDK8184035.1 GNAT family protein [Paenibacillus sp. UMB4589-SE434]
MLHKEMDIRLLTLDDAESLLHLRMSNRQFLQPFEPLHAENHYTLGEQQKLLASKVKAAEAGQAYAFGIFSSSGHQLIGKIELSAIARGPLQNANIGYYLDQHHNGKGYATAAVSYCVNYAFDQLGLHRIQAGVMPRNIPSKRVLEKAGFRQEGLALRYLNINGVWEDHALFAITTEDRA